MVRAGIGFQVRARGCIDRVGLSAERQVVGEQELRNRGVGGGCAIPTATGNEGLDDRRSVARGPSDIDQHRPERRFEVLPCALKPRRFVVGVDTVE